MHYFTHTHKKEETRHKKLGKHLTLPNKEKIEQSKQIH